MHLSQQSSSALLHAQQAGVADEVFFHFGIDGALRPQPRKGALGFLREFHGAADGRGSVTGGRLGFADFDFHQLGAGTDADIHAAGGDEFRLGDRLGGEQFQDGEKVFIGHFAEAGVEAADVAGRNATEAAEIGLGIAAALAVALDGSGKKTHKIAGLQTERNG